MEKETEIRPLQVASILKTVFCKEDFIGQDILIKVRLLNHNLKKRDCISDGEAWGEGCLSLVKNNNVGCYG